MKYLISTILPDVRDTIASALIVEMEIQCPVVVLPAPSYSVNADAIFTSEMEYLIISILRDV